MDNKIPKVSIGMNVYNGENYLKEAIDSILAQTFRDFELIISDNASTDKTEEICRSYAKKDKRVRYYRYNINRGAAWNANNTFKLSKGKYFRWHSHDDLIAPCFLEKCVKVLDNDPGVVLCYSKTRIIDEKGKVKGDYRVKIRTNSKKITKRFCDIVLIGHNCYQIFGLIRSDILKKSELFGDYSGSDKVVLAELALAGRFCEIPEFLFISRDHPKQSVKLLPDRYVYALWFDPKNKGKTIFPHWRMLKEYINTIGSSKINLWSRLICYKYMLNWVIGWRKELLKDLNQALIRGRRA
ncbi:glycosyltransferase [Candidatus Woesearchaeota archaeon]|nr:glycosyltransferase [Candidatus Woesearchaeota archaeon]